MEPMESIENYHQAKARMELTKLSLNIRALFGVTLLIAAACYFYLIFDKAEELSTHLFAAAIVVGLAFLVLCNHISLKLFKQAQKLHSKAEDELMDRIMDLAEIAFNEGKGDTPPSFLSKGESSLWLRRYKQMINIEAKKNKEKA